MKTLHITVANKVATCSTRYDDIICGNSDYQIEFNFDAEWDAYETKTARFIWNGKYVDEVFKGRVCPVPVVANTERLEVGVYADEISTPPEPEKLHTTTSAVIHCKKSIRCNTDAKHDGTVIVPEGMPILKAKNITENGKYLASKDGADGFHEVNVAVEGEIVDVWNGTGITFIIA